MTTPERAIPTWKYMLELARYRLPIYLASGILASILYYLFPLIPGLIVREVFDLLSINTLSPEASQKQIWFLIWVLIGTSVARVIVLILAGVAETLVHLFVNMLLQRNMLRHVLDLPGARPLPHSPGEAIARFRDDVDEIPSFLTWTIDPVGQFLAIGVGVVIMAQINPRITLAVIVPLVLVMVLINLATRRIRAYRKAAQQSIGQVTGLVGEIFSSVTSVKVAGAEKHVVAHLDELNEKRRAATLRDTLFSQFLNTISYNMGNFGTGVLLFAAAGQMINGNFTIGDFTLFVLFVQWLTVITGMFGSFLTRYRQVGVSLDRLLEIMSGGDPMQLVAHNPLYIFGDLPDFEETNRKPVNPLVELNVNSLTCLFEETGRGIENVSFGLERESMTIITGRIGSGKTTLLRALLGLLPAEGDIYWNGERVEDPGRFFMPPYAAYTPQVPRLFSDSLKNNILLGRESAYGKELQQAVEAAVLDKDIGVLDQGLDTLVGPRGVKLSGGQRQRVAAARMFIREPELLVFDDLSSALDINTERLLWERMFSVAKPPTVLAVSHRRSVLRRADKIIILKDGRVDGVGKLDELLADNEEMKRLWSGDLSGE